MLKTAITLCAALALTGCGSVPGRFDNLIVVSLAGDRAFVSSLYGPIGITAELRGADARELARLRAADTPAPAASRPAP